MLKRRTPTDEERRLRRIRWAWGSTFAALLAGALLMFAWVGAAATRKNPPMMMALREPTLGILSFSLSLAEDAFLAPHASSGESLKRQARAAAKSCRETLAPAGQVFFWKDEASGEDRWLAYVPIERPQRFRVHRLTEVIETTGLFDSPNSPRSAGSLGVFWITGEMLILSSEPSLPPFATEEGPMPSIRGRARYTSTSGYVPAPMASRLGALSEFSGPVLIEWPSAAPGGELDEVEIHGGESGLAPRLVPWFNPLMIPEPPE